MSRLSPMAHALIPSEIIKQGNEVNERIRNGEEIFNLTIGDFDSRFFPIPKLLEEEIVAAYQNGKTTYPPAAGLMSLRTSIANFLTNMGQPAYDPQDILISGGGRPLIYAAYRAIVGKGDKVIYTAPSWNNNHYTQFMEGEHVMLETQPENQFIPTAKELKPLIKGARLLALCSPLNPTGTTFTKEALGEICDLILEENKTRGKEDSPLFLLFDQIYWALTFGEAEHASPVGIRPAMRDYTIHVDGITKAFCATGVRVGWAYGPSDVINTMRGLLSHVGAWSPMAEQTATAQFLSKTDEVKAALEDIKDKVYRRLTAVHELLNRLKDEGFPVYSIPPQGALYLTVKIEILGKKKKDGHLISSTADITSFLLNEAKIAMVPFASFGATNCKEWYRLSVGMLDENKLPNIENALRQALSQLSS